MEPKSQSSEGEALDDPRLLPDTYVSPSATALRTDGSPMERPGMSVGPYKLLEQIGEGGFGVVFMAEQQHPIRRRVALKVIKPGMDTRQVIARFEAERQALALMDHPNIAKVLDAGATASGRPYFVMELVQGIPITAFCDRNHFSPRRRLELFVQVCHAVQHAHQKGIIHRDLKPSNVPVTLHDGAPVPKVIDFGIAKATGQQTLTDKTLFTRFAQLIGTPMYMSPEQAELSGLDVDTRSDIYSLGVLLYELLTGTTPFDGQKLGEAAQDEIRRIIREEDPPTPSTRLSTLGERSATISAQRGTDVRRLSRIVRGELDWIVMRAIEKDRRRRYDSAGAMAADVQRHLRGEAVEACPPSRMYRLRKFARRNRVALTTASLVLLALLLGTAGSTWQAVRASAAERRAESEAQRARTEAATATAISDFLINDLLEQAHPDHQPEPHVRLSTVLDRAADRIDGRFSDQPLVEAAVRSILGQSYQSLDQPQRAALQFSRVWSLRSETLGPEHPETLNASRRVATGLSNQGRQTEAQQLLESILESQQRLLGEDHEDTLTTMDQLAFLLRIQNNHVHNELYERIYNARRRTLGPEHRDTLYSFAMWIVAKMPVEKYEVTRRQLHELLEIRRRTLGDDFPDTIDTLGHIAYLEKQHGYLDESRRTFEQAVDLYRRRYGPEHSATLMGLNNLATVLADQGELDQAREIYEHVLATLERSGAQPRGISMLSQNLASIAQTQKRHEDVLVHLQRVLDVDRQLLGEGSPTLITTLHHMAKTLFDLNRIDEAEAIFAQAVSIMRRTTAQQESKVHAESQQGHVQEANVLIARRDFAAAESLLLKSIELLRADSQPSITDRQETLHEIVKLYSLWRPDNLPRWRQELAFCCLEPIQEQIRQFNTMLASDSEDAKTFAARGRAYARAGFFAEALSDYDRSVQLDPTDPATAYTRACLLAYLGDIDALQSARRDMLNRFGQTGDAVTAFMTAATGLLLLDPGDADDLELLRSLFQCASADATGTIHPAIIPVLQAMLDYRDGRYEQALATISAPTSKDPSAAGRARRELLTAMVYARLGRTDESRSANWRATITRRIEVPELGLHDLDSGGLENWLTFHVLLGEAESLSQEEDIAGD